MADLAMIKLPPLPDSLTWKGDENDPVASPHSASPVATSEQKEEKSDIKSQLSDLLSAINIAKARLLANPTHASGKRLQEYEDVEREVQQIFSALSGSSPHIMDALRDRSDAIRSVFTMEEEESDDEVDGDYQDDAPQKSYRLSPAQIQKDIQGDSMMLDLAVGCESLHTLLANNSALTSNIEKMTDNSQADLMTAVAYAGMLAEGADENGLQAFMRETRSKMVEKALASGAYVSDAFIQERLTAIEMEGGEICAAMGTGPYETKKRLIKAARHFMELQLRQRMQESSTYFAEAQRQIADPTHLKALDSDGAALHQEIKNTLQNLPEYFPQMPEVLPGNSTPMDKASLVNLAHDMGFDNAFATVKEQTLGNYQACIQHQEIFQAALEETQKTQHELSALLEGASDKGIHHVAQLLGIEESEICAHIAEFRNAHHAAPENIRDKIMEFNHDWKHAFGAHHTHDPSHHC